MSPKLIRTNQRRIPKIIYWLGFAGIVILYFFVRPIRVGFISLLVDYIEPALSTVKGVGIINSATTLILSIGNQEAHSQKNLAMDSVLIPFSYSPHLDYGR